MGPFLQTPRKFGHYILLGPLGSGGMGEVYLAQSINSHGINRRFAIKVMKKELTRDPKMISLFKSEAALAIQLNHSAVASIQEFGIAAGQFFIVMDYVDGISLAEFQENLEATGKSVALPDAIYLVREIAAGLDYVYRVTDQQTQRPLQIIHGDLSPHNVMVNREGEVKIIDFGVARSIHPNASLSDRTVVGKKKYMAPELSQGIRQGHQSDIYSLGAILWELIFGEPYYDSIPANMVPKGGERYLVSRFPDHVEVPQRVAAILQKSLAGDLTERYSSVSEMLSDLNMTLSIHFPKFSRSDLRENLSLPAPKGPIDPNIVLASLQEVPEASPLQKARESITSFARRLIKLAIVFGLGYLLMKSAPNLLERFQQFKSEKLLKTQPIAKRTERLDFVAPKSTVYSFNVFSEPKGARVFLNDSLVQSVTPTTLKIRSDVPAKLVLQLSGFKDCTAMIDPKVGQYSCTFERK